MKNQHTIDTVNRKSVLLSIPTDVGKFRMWADRECGHWPSDLQLLAYDVCMGKRSMDEFKAEWLRRG